MRKNKGFTLVELLVVIVIIGILAAAAISVFGGGTDKAQLAVIKNDVNAMFSSGTLMVADQGTSGGFLDINNVVSEGYLDAKPNNPISGKGYAYAGSVMTVNNSQLNPVVYAAGQKNSGGLYEKGGAGAISVDTDLGSFHGNPGTGASTWATS